MRSPISSRRSSLRVASGELGNRGNVETIFIALNDDIELALHSNLDSYFRQFAAKPAVNSGVARFMKEKPANYEELCRTALAGDLVTTPAPGDSRAS